MKYLVMECHPAYAVVLSEDGTFRKVANIHYEVGQSVTDVIHLNLPEQKFAEKRRPGWLKTVTAAAACLALAVTAFFYTENTPYASVYLSINPQVRIDVNRRDAVVDVEGVNQDGQVLVENYDYKGKELDLVMDDLVDLAIDKGYLHEGGKITLSLDADEAWVDSHSGHMNEQLSQYLAEKITVTIDMQQASVPAEPTEPETVPEPVVIPVKPTYGESDYGEDREEDGASDYDRDEDRDDDREDGQTDYDSDDDDGDSGYEAPKTSKSEKPKKKDRESDYDKSDDDGSDYADKDSEYDD